MLSPFLRPAYLAPAAGGAALVAWLLPTHESLGRRLLVVGFVWLLLAYVLFALRERAGARAAARPAAAPVGTTPPLDAEEQSAVREIVALFVRAGVFAPGALKPEQLFEAAADQAAPVTQGVVLSALHEAGLHHADFDAALAMANLAFHASHSEQFADTLRDQIAGLVRLARGALDVRELAIDLRLADGPGPHPLCTVAMTVNGSAVTATYAPAAKYLSTHVHVALAVAMRRAACGARLAWIWDDQGVWISALTPTALTLLNAGPGAGAWEWVDDSEPIAAGETPGLVRSV
jgi:hypothetical protein